MSNLIIRVTYEFTVSFHLTQRGLDCVPQIRLSVRNNSLRQTQKGKLRAACT